MRNKWIIIRIETKAREFESKMLIAYRLILEGYAVIIKSDFGGQIDRFPIGAYLINSVYSNARKLMNEITSSGNKVVVLDEEGLVMIDEDKYLMRIDDVCMEKSDLFLCYGNHQRNIVINSFPNYSDKIIITGNPRLNLLNAMFMDLDNSKVNEINIEHGQFILIVSNFSYVNMKGAVSASKKDRLKRVYEQLMQMELIKDESYIAQFEHYNELFEEFLLLVKELSRNYPNQKIIVRPHPSEDHCIWDELAKDLNNVEIIYDGNLTQWIKASSLVIQNGCTSAIESLYLNKPCISYRPIINSSYDQPLPSYLSVNVMSLKEVFQIVNDIVINHADYIILDKYPKFKELAKEFISFQDNDSSVREIVDLISKVDIKFQNYNRFKYYLRGLAPKYFKLHIKNISKLLIAKGYRLVKTNNNDGMRLIGKISSYVRAIEYEEKKRGVYTKKEINQIIEKFNVIYGKKALCKVDKLSKNTYQILLEKKELKNAK